MGLQFSVVKYLHRINRLGTDLEYHTFENDLLIVGSELADFPEANDAGAAYI